MKNNLCYRICLNHKNNTYRLFNIWYLSDWSYYINDVLDRDHKYIATKIWIPMNMWREETCNVKRDDKHTYKIEVFKPKISHHISWKAQISWYWILSWFDEANKAKWLSIESYNLLSSTNDWGPIFIFNIWIEILKDLPTISLFDEKQLSKNYMLIQKGLIIDLSKKNNKYNYVVEWFHILKNKNILNNSYKIYPKYWKIPLQILQTPDHIPYCIWIVCVKDPRAYNPKIITYWWAPGVIKKWIAESLYLIIASEDNVKDLKNLHYEK